MLDKWQQLSAGDAFKIAKAAIVDQVIPSGTLRVHPLGFLIANVSAWEMTMRLHVWHPSQGGPVDSDYLIHSHVFELNSRVLCGSLRNVIYDVRESVAGTREIYRVTYAGDSSILEPTQVYATADKVDTQTWAKGESYSFPAGSYHETVVPDDELCATLVLPIPTSMKAPSVLGPRGGGRRVFERVTIGRPGADLILQDLLAKLKA
jgi:hypothetical protein